MKTGAAKSHHSGQYARSVTRPPGVISEGIARNLREIGLKQGDVVLVHSAMSTIGHVDGGAGTVVRAFLNVIGDRGTLVAPTFTIRHQREKNPVVDPRNDWSEMGAISEAVRTWPGALRSVAFRHSFAAIGRRAEMITNVDPRLSVFDVRSSFGVMLALNTQVVLLGVTYSSSTSHHFAEALCDVPHRHHPTWDVPVRQDDGSLVQMTFTDYQPRPNPDGTYRGVPGADFNRLGSMLEAKGLVAMTAIGNAAVRRFAMRDLIDLALVEAEKDCGVFLAAEPGSYSGLGFGTIVMSPPKETSAGTRPRTQWCVMDPEKVSG